MKRPKRSRLSAAALFLLILLSAASCGGSHHNELTYRLIPGEQAVGIDSLKTRILAHEGTGMLIIYPDSDIVIVQYDRFRTHEDLIASCFSENGYTVELIKKTSIRKETP